MSIKVVKFGGSSLADANQIKKAAAIIKEDSNRRYAVVSAPGKRFSDDIKVTDMFYSCYEAAKKGQDFSEIFEKIKERYNGIIKELGLTLNLDREYAIIEGCLLGNAGRDYAASRGEYLNGVIIAEYLGFDFVDAADVVVFSENGEFMLDKTIELISERLKNSSYAVIPGFYGMREGGTIKTFSRGGSDVTGSLVARAVNAEIYENWTDVSGFLICDPRIVEGAVGIETITYTELRELAYMGAGVLHEDAIFPVRTAGIPINIRNTNAPADKGTMIVAETNEESKNIITGIAGKKGFSAINIEKDMMNSEIGFGMKVLDVLRECNISFEHLPSGIDTMSVVLATSCIEGREEEIIAKINKAVSPDKLEIEHGLALLAVVGRGMRSTRGTAARTFAALAHARVNVKMIDQGSSELNIIIGVSEEDFEKATRAIYDCFVN